jgi:hypothetical protein
MSVAHHVERDAGQAAMASPYRTPPAGRTFLSVDSAWFDNCVEYWRQSIVST